LRGAKKGVALQGGPKLPHDHETEKAEKANQGNGKRSCDPVGDSRRCAIKRHIQAGRNER
jgi:hypothetical protein